MLRLVPLLPVSTLADGTLGKDIKIKKGHKWVPELIGLVYSEHRQLNILLLPLAACHSFYALWWEAVKLFWENMDFWKPRAEFSLDTSSPCHWSWQLACRAMIKWISSFETIHPVTLGTGALSTVTRIPSVC